MHDLEMASTEDLIQELFNRTTFIGVLIYTPEEHKFSGQSVSHIRVMASSDQVGSQQLLEIGLKAVKEGA